MTHAAGGAARAADPARRAVKPLHWLALGLVVLVVFRQHPAPPPPAPRIYPGTDNPLLYI